MGNIAFSGRYAASPSGCPMQKLFVYGSAPTFVGTEKVVFSFRLNSFDVDYKNIFELLFAISHFVLIFRRNYSSIMV